MRYFVLFVLVVSIFLHEEAAAQWTQTSGPEGGYPMSFVSTGSSIFAGSFGGGIFRSTDNGDTWIWAGSGLTLGLQIRSLAVDGAMLYAGTSNGIYRSTNNGDSWSAINTGLSSTNTNKVFVFGSAVYAGLVSDRIFRSTNQGASWEVDTAGLGDNVSGVTSFESNGSVLFAGASPGGVFRSTNNGDTWTAVNSGLTNQFVNTLAVINGVLLAGTQGGGVYYSTDSGDSWSGGDFDITLALAVIGNDVFQATLAGVMRSSDNGASWFGANTGIPPTNNTRSLGVFGTTLFAGMGNNGDRGGIYRSTDLGGNWTEANTGYINSSVLVLAVSGSEVFAGTNDGSLYKTSNNGTNWTFVKNFGTGVSSFFVSSGTYWYLGTGASGGNAFRSSDNGNTWSYAGTGLPFSGTIKGIVGVGGYIIAGSSSGGIYRTINDSSWTVSNTGLTHTTVNVLAVMGLFTYAGTSGGGFFISSNSGENWTASNSGLTNLNVLSIISPATDVIYAGTSGGGVFKSTNNGATWSATNTGLTGTVVRALDFNGSSIYAGTNAGVFASSDGGANWEIANTGLNNTSIQSLRISDRTYIIAGTAANGAWRRPFSELTAVDEIVEYSPSGYSLSQNFPNPFNPVTHFQFSISNLQFVSLKVFDVLGKEVAVLISQEMHPGTYQAQWDASGFASGLYHYRLQAGSFSQTQKMVLIK